MHYKREQVNTEIDIIEVTPAEFSKANEMFINALKNRFPTIDLTGVEYNTVVMTDGRFRAEFKVVKGGINS